MDPCRPDRQMILTARRHVDTTDHQWNCAVSPLLPPPPAWWRQQDQHGVALLVVRNHYGRQVCWQEAPTDTGRCCVCACCIGATCCVVSIGSPVSLTVEWKHQRTIGTKSWILHLRTESRKVTLKRINILPTKELPDASYCTQQFHRLCCETLKDWHIHKYTQPLITLMAIQWLAERTQQVELRSL